jgi:hypothetical protein
MTQLGQDHLDLLPFSKVVRSQRQHFPPGKDSGLGHLNELEKSLVVSFPW